MFENVCANALPKTDRQSMQRNASEIRPPQAAGSRQGAWACARMNLPYRKLCAGQPRDVIQVKSALPLHGGKMTYKQMLARLFL
jgi:hypothetical protein